MDNSKFAALCSYTSNALLIAGFITLLISFFIPSTGLYGMITGYSFILAGLLGFMLLFIGLSSNAINLYTLFTILPFIILSGIIVFLIYSFSKNQSIIILNHVSPDYYYFSNVILAIILLIIILLLSMNSMSSKSNNSSISLPFGYIYVLYLLSIFGFISAFNLNTILTLYVTDGFSNHL